MGTINLSWEQCEDLASDMAGFIRSGCKVYGVPRGGIHTALLLQAALGPVFGTFLTENPDEADVFVDDIIDSGATKAKYNSLYPNKPFHALVTKNGSSDWISFPWERMTKEDGPRENIVRILQYIGEDPNREGLKETPDRVIKSYEQLFAGYKQSPSDIMKVFIDGACDEMVLLKDVEFYSTCEHHMLPFHGRAHVAYIPDRRIVGLSKLARLIEIYARRLQVQERLTVQITNALDSYLHPKGSACVLEASHMCMTCRGVNKQNSRMVTSSLTGAFKDNLQTRNEFFSLIRG